MIRQIIIALCIGCAATVWFMQKDERVKQYIGVQFKTAFQNAISCTFDGTVESVNFFSPRITLSNVHVYDQKNPGWTWGAQRFTISCSWWYLLLYRVADMHVDIEKLEACSAIKNGMPVIADHMEKVFMGLDVGMPLELKSIAFKRSSARFHDDERDMDVQFVWQSESKKMQDRLKTSGYLLDGSMRMGDRTLFESLKGSLQADVGAQGDGQTTLNTDCSIELPYLPKAIRQTFISGSWKGTSGTFSLKNVHEQVAINPIQIFFDGTRARCSIRGSVPLSSVWRFAHNDAAKEELMGACSLLCDMRYEENEYAVMGRISFDDCAYKDHMLGSGVITYAREQGEWKGNLQLNQDAWYGVKGAWQWQESSHTGSLKIANTDTIQLPHFTRMKIDPGLFESTINMDAAGALSGNYKAAVHSFWQDTMVECEGTIETDYMHLESKGTIHNKPYHCMMQLQPTMNLSSFSYDDPAGNSLIRMSADQIDDRVTHAVVSLPFMRAALEHMYTMYPIQVEGSIAASIKREHNSIDVSLTTMDALMRVPQTYNVMREGKCNLHIDNNTQMITIQDLSCQFHEGHIAINRATIQYDDAHEPTFMHIPVLVDSLMLNMEQGFLAKISGYGLLTQHASAPANVMASVIIDRAYIKENLFSGTFQKNLFRYTGGPFASYHNDITCDVHIVSRIPMRVKTPFLETAARVNVTIKNSFKDPHVSGSIDLLSGFLAFPYRPLYITKGTIYFLPHQLYDPSIELVAKNKIKKYNVELQVNGSLQNHQIILDATPSLTEEQIVSLLLVGSEEESLNVVMPALIMQNLQKIMFGYDQSPRAIDKVFSSLLQPFSGIHVVPSFSDQTGRGGLRGAIEIDVNDRWRALIQKNFSLTEDTRLEVEYLVSDEISVRGVANERRDVGAEVEMRWKF